jgi:hypothetical protein
VHQVVGELDTVPGFRYTTRLRCLPVYPSWRGSVSVLGSAPPTRTIVRVPLAAAPSARLTFDPPEAALKQRRSLRRSPGAGRRLGHLGRRRSGRSIRRGTRCTLTGSHLAWSGSRLAGTDRPFGRDRALTSELRRATVAGSSARFVARLACRIPAARVMAARAIRKPVRHPFASVSSTAPSHQSHRPINRTDPSTDPPSPPCSCPHL